MIIPASNPVTVTWDIYVDGSQVNLQSRDISVYLVSASKKVQLQYTLSEIYDYRIVIPISGLLLAMEGDYSMEIQFSDDNELRTLTTELFTVSSEATGITGTTSEHVTVESGIIDNPQSMQDEIYALDLRVTSSESDIDSLQSDVGDIKDEIILINNEVEALALGLTWKAEVETETSGLAAARIALSSAYPTAVQGWVANVNCTQVGSESVISYVYNEDVSNWVVLRSSAIPNATQSTDGLMSKEDKLKLDTLDEGLQLTQDQIDKLDALDADILTQDDIDAVLTSVLSNLNDSKRVTLDKLVKAYNTLNNNGIPDHINPLFRQEGLYDIINDCYNEIFESTVGLKDRVSAVEAKQVLASGVIQINSGASYSASRGLIVNSFGTLGTDFIVQLTAFGTVVHYHYESVSVGTYLLGGVATPNTIGFKIVSSGETLQSKMSVHWSIIKV